MTDDPHHVRCQHCGRVSAQRLGDIGWGCQCQVNPRREPAAKKETDRPKNRNLFKDSGLDSVQWWDHSRNSVEAWKTLTARARSKTYWKCPTCSAGFAAAIEDMAPTPRCPHCASRELRKREELFNRLGDTPVSAIPELLEAWADEADPSTVPVAGSWKSRRFACPKGHHPRVSPSSFLLSGCPSCHGAATLEERLSEVEVNPKAFAMNAELFEQWHPTANPKLDPRRLSPNSRRQVWWREASCGHEWRASPADREKRQRLRCPECRTILDSLAYHFPQLVAQWSKSNPLSAWQVRPAASLPFVPEWVCADHPTHVWTASLAARTSGTGCPSCRGFGKSAIELLHLKAAQELFGDAASGLPWRNTAFTARSVWYPDITVTLTGGRSLVIEYDGAYWHGEKYEIDTAKTKDLLATGALVVRLREHPLPALAISSERYLELVTYSSAPEPDSNLSRIAQWLRT
ncbi:zinc-ribbon domain-containing protein [Actinomycetospora corticicola]|uniref:DNA-directed RNA polymerase subunit RPC12/RpoP n=1 Tax=Actinomycetospora corticicola TaxID=663602 RepID=A0A7Y9DVE8_9PSEU|nr:zinc-ribbon domain-containing protein [Actinomycetospora corticicola]NYD36146.1 DNA-directed RNA polymerase subunit RPC12/RpoP [Actinomycetospora corticicola]